MSKEQSSAVKGAKLPLDLLVRTTECKFIKTPYLRPDEIIIGVCIKEKAWLPVTFSPDFEAPEEFLCYAKEVSGLPLLYPNEEDITDLKENFSAVTDTIAQIRTFKQQTNHKCTLRLNDFCIEKIGNSLAYSKGIKKNVPIRFVVDLSQIA